MRYSLAVAAAVMASAAIASPVPQPEVHVEYKTVNAYTTVTQQAEAKVVTQTAPVVTEIAATVTQTASPAPDNNNKKEMKWGNYGGAKGWTSAWTYTYEVKPSPAPVKETKTQEVKPTSTYAPAPPAATTTKAAAQPTATQSGDSYNTGDSFNDECLKSHNDDRAKHGAAPLTWNTTMANFALDKVSKTCVFEHSGGPYGENLAMGYKTAAEAIAAWYDEEKMYDYASGQFSSATGHFTQMVWKSAKQVGCGSYDCPGMGNFLTCNYDTGNVISQFVENVLPPTSSSY